MFINNAKIDRIFVFLVLEQLEWRILSLQIVDIDAKEGKDVDKIERNDRMRSDASLLSEKYMKFLTVIFRLYGLMP